MVKVHKLIMVQDSNTGTGQKYKVDKGVDIVYTVLYCTVYCIIYRYCITVSKSGGTKKKKEARRENRLLIETNPFWWAASTGREHSR